MSRLSPEGVEAIRRANAARGFGVKGSELTKKAVASRRAKAPRHISSPAKTAAGRAASARVANKAQEDMVKRFKYMMEFLPDPVFTMRQVNATDAILPAVEGLTKGKVLTVEERIELTMAVLTISRNNNVNDTACIFTKRMKEFLPDNIYPGIDIFYHYERAEARVKAAIDEYRAWVEEFLSKCERKLAGMYIAVGKWQSPYLEVLQRRFRDNWSTQQKIDVKADVKAEEKVDTTINFNFTTVPSKLEVPNGSGH